MLLRLAPSSRLSGRIMPPLCLMLVATVLAGWVVVEPFSVTKPTRIWEKQECQNCLALLEAYPYPCARRRTGLPAISKPFIRSSACCASVSLLYLFQRASAKHHTKRERLLTGRSSNLSTSESHCQSEDQSSQWLRKAQRSDEYHFHAERRAKSRRKCDSRARANRHEHRNQGDCNNECSIS